MRDLASAVVVRLRLRLWLWVVAFVVVVTLNSVGAKTTAAAGAAPFGGRADEALPPLPAAEEAEAALRARLERFRQNAREERQQRGGPIAVAAAARALEQLMRRNLLRREDLREKDEDHKGRNPEEERRNRADDGRNLIYHGTPTGGNKYRFLVSMWASITNNVRNPKFLIPSICHGVMVTDDVFVTLRGCTMELFALRMVVVGDYDSSRPMNESVQVREVEHLADDFGWTYGLLKEPVTFPGFFPAQMNNDSSVPEPGQNLTVVGYGGRLWPFNANESSFFFNQSAWPGPALETTLVAGNRTFCKDLWDQAGIPVEKEHLYSFCGAPLSAIEDAQPCKDDKGGPVLDSNNVLVGLTVYPGCGGLPGTQFFRWSHMLRFVHVAICSLSRSDVLPLACPDFFGPLDKLQVGYPWSEIPDLTGGVRARNGFRPVEVSQFPPPGSIIRFDSVTNVTITGTDSANQSLPCFVYIQVPPLITCGTVTVDVPTGTSLQRGVFTPNQDPTNLITVGTAFKMKGILQNKLAGRGAITSRLRKGSDKYTGSIEFKGNRTKGALNNLAIVEPFNIMNESVALQVDLEVRDNINPERNIASYTVYCQEVF